MIPLTVPSHEPTLKARFCECEDGSKQEAKYGVHHTTYINKGDANYIVLEH
jgi:hypothetical protein